MKQEDITKTKTISKTHQMLLKPQNHQGVNELFRLQDDEEATGVGTLFILL